MQEEIKQLHSKMRELVIESGINIEKYDQRIVCIPEYMEMDVFLAFKKLEKEWTTLYNLKQTLTPQAWRLIISFSEMNNSEELVYLRKCYKNIRMTYAQAFKGMSYVSKKKNRSSIEFVQDQSEDAGDDGSDT